MALSWHQDPNQSEEILIVGSELGNLACISIKSVVEKARKQRDDILQRKEHGEAADVISGRIFESMEKPHDSPEYIYMPETAWLQERAHRGSIDQIIYCKHTPPIILTLGFDVRVCIWHPLTGEALGTLEQGLAEGLGYERRTKWRFPIDAHVQVEHDLKALAAAVVSEAGSEEESGKDSKEASEDGKAGAEQGKPAGSKEAEQKEQKPHLSRSESSPAGFGRRPEPFKLNGIEYPDYSKTPSRLLKSKIKYDHDWFAGPLGPGLVEGQLPYLSSGMRRMPNVKSQTAVVSAAKRLSKVLGTLDGKKFDSSW